MSVFPHTVHMVRYISVSYYQASDTITIVLLQLRTAEDCTCAWTAGMHGQARMGKCNDDGHPRAVRPPRHTPRGGVIRAAGPQRCGGGCLQHYQPCPAAPSQLIDHP